MKRVRNLFALALFLGLFLVNTTIANAANVTALNVSASGNKISVSGTTDAGVLACAVLVYDSTGTTLKAMETCAVSGGKYSYTLAQSFAAGSYLVKVADYDGGSYVTATVTVHESSDDSSSSSSEATTLAAAAPTAPKTGENTALIVWMIAGLASCGIVSIKIRKNQ